MFIGLANNLFVNKLLKGVAASSAALLMLADEDEGLAIDFTDEFFSSAPGSAAVKDTTTPANDYNGVPFNLVDYTGASKKLLRDSDGLLYENDPDNGLPYEWDENGNLLGIRIEEARTNLCLHSNDLTQSAWTKSNVTAAKTATGPDGVANSASTLTATAANATALQAITSTSAVRITSCYIKRRTGSGNIDLTQNNGSTWTTVTVTSSWTRVNLSSVTSANPTVGIRIVTSGNAVDVAFFQHEVGAFVTSPIQTAGSTVTRAGDNGLAIDASLFPTGTDMTVYAKFKARNRIDTTRIIGLNSDTNTNDSSVFEISGTVGVGSWQETNEAFLDIDMSDISTDFRKAALAWDSTERRLMGTGAEAVVSDENPLESFDSVFLGSQGANEKVGDIWLAELMIVPRKFNDIELEGIVA